MPEAAIETISLQKIYHRGKPNEVRAVDGVDLKIGRGTMAVLRGPSGSGKTTLLSVLACLTKPTSGTFYCLGEQVSKWTEQLLTEFRRRHIGIVFQHFNLISGLTTRQNIALPLIPLGRSLRQNREAVAQAAEQLGIAHRLDFRVDLLSGGEMQRVAIARALVMQPEIIFADEPTAHLDQANSENVLAILDGLKQQGHSLIVTTHDPLVANSSIVDQQIYMQDGRLQS